MANTSDIRLESTIPNLGGILRNSIYITFNAPVVDEYHRSIFVTYPSTQDGTLFHAKYTDETATWVCERREVKNISKTQSLVLLYRLGSLPADPPVDPDTWFKIIEDTLLNIDMDPTAMREDDLVKRLGNSVLGGYSCIIWSVDAVAKLASKGLIELNGLSAEDTLTKVRLIAGPQDGKIMAGKDHGPSRVFN